MSETPPPATERREPTCFDSQPHSFETVTRCQECGYVQAVHDPASPPGDPAVVYVCEADGEIVPPDRIKDGQHVSDYEADGTPILCGFVHPQKKESAPSPADPADGIAQIQERLSKITPGKWIADDFCEQDGECVRVGTTDESPHYYQRSATIAICCYTEKDEMPAPGEPVIGLIGANHNADFIAHAPADIAFLLQRVVVLQEALKQTAEWLRSFLEPMCSTPAEEELVADAHAMATRLDEALAPADRAGAEPPRVSNPAP